MSKLHLEILDKNRLSLFNSLTAFGDIGILGDDTAIALQIGHRQSYDFDIFTFDPLKENLWSKVRSVLGAGNIKTMDNPNQLSFTTTSNLSITFFYDLYPTAFPPASSPALPLMNLRDLAINKARTIGQRGKWRDYVDLYFLLKEKIITLDQLVQDARKRTLDEFPTRLFLQQLTYFADITDYTIDFIKKSVSPDQVKDYFLAEASHLAAQTPRGDF